jgi:hypothetical protein
MGYAEIASGTAFTALESGGFSGWQKIKGLASSFQEALGFDLKIAAIFDRDYWCDEEVDFVGSELGKKITFWHIHSCKEIENYLLVPDVLDRALSAAVREKDSRQGSKTKINTSALEIFRLVTDPLQGSLRSQFIAKRQEFFKNTPVNLATRAEEATAVFEKKWNDISQRFKVVPGKQVLASIREKVSEEFGVSLTDYRIVSSFQKGELPQEITNLVDKIEQFRLS